MRTPEHARIPELLIGAPATEVVKKILKVNPGIESLTLRIHPCIGDDPKKYWEKEEEVQEIPLSRDDILSQGLESWIYYLGVIDEHRVDWKFLEEEFNISPHSRRFENFTRDWPLARFLSIDSRVKLPEPAHIPMLDFDCEKSFGNLLKLLEILRKQGLRGYVLDSSKGFKKGFHFWGINPLPESSLFPEFNWREFLESNKENPLIDKQFIDIALALGYTCLRITEDLENGRPAPVVAATV